MVIIIISEDRIAYVCSVYNNVIQRSLSSRTVHSLVSHKGDENEIEV
jgi:6,7-dimethyl-8-ribityllumazine synthase